MAEQIAPQSVRSSILALLDVHLCGGTRHLVSSAALLDREVTGSGATQAGDTQRIGLVITVDDLGELMTTHEDDAWSDLPTHCPPGGVAFGDFDRRLAACAESAASSLDLDARVATDDEDLILNLWYCVERGLTSSVPIASVDLMFSLYECGALQMRHLEALLEAEDIRLDQHPEMQDRKRRTKEERLAGVAARLGLNGR